MLDGTKCGRFPFGERTTDPLAFPSTLASNAVSDLDKRNATVHPVFLAVERHGPFNTFLVT